MVGKIGLMIVIAQIDPDKLLDYDEWIFGALEKEHGKENVARYAAEMYDCMDSSEYMGVVEDAAMSNS